MSLTTAGGIAVPNATQTTTYLAFYPVLTTQLGTGNSVAAGTANSNEHTGCFAAATTAAAASFVSGAGNAVTPNRLYWSGAGANYAADIAAGPMISIDFLLAATFQDSFTGTGTRTAAPANYCDKQVQSLADSTAVDVTTTQGLKNTTKCTYFIIVAADKGAPSFKLTTLGYYKFQLHYVEWASTDMTFIATNTYMGTVAAASTFPMPVKNTYPASGTAINFAFPQTAGGDSHANWRPMDWTAGSMGPFQYYAPSTGSPYLGVTTTSVDSKVLMNQLNAKIAENTTYNSAKSTYDTDRTAYNTALSNEKTRAADFFKSIFEAPITIPTRPCQPTQPTAWSGPTIDWDVAGAAIGTVNETGKLASYGVITRAALSGVNVSLNSGFLAATADTTSATTALNAGSGHTFGLLGQGDATNPADGMAWANRVVVATTTHGMMVSMFPYDNSDTTGVAASKTIVMNIKAVTWNAWKSFQAPSQPAASVAPDAAAATYLAASAAAVAAVAATMM